MTQTLKGQGIYYKYLQGFGGKDGPNEWKGGESQ